MCTAAVIAVLSYSSLFISFFIPLLPLLQSDLSLLVQQNVYQCLHTALTSVLELKTSSDACF